MTSDNEHTWTIVTDNKGITFSNNKIPFKEHDNGGLTMTYEESIEILKNRDLVDGKFFIDEAIDLAIEALEKVEQLEKENNKLREKMCECAKIVKAYQKYCNECCQPIDWSD